VDLRDALPQVHRRWQRHHAPSLRVQEKPDLRAAQRQRLNHRRHRVCFRSNRPQKTAAHRQVQEKVPRLDRRTRRVGGGLGPAKIPGENPDGDASHGPALARRQRQRGDCADGVQSLAPKTQRGDQGEVIGGGDLAGRVPGHRALRVARGHPRAIVLDPDQGHPTTLYLDLHPARPGV